MAYVKLILSDNSTKGESELCQYLDSIIGDNKFNLCSVLNQIRDLSAIPFLPKIGHISYTCILNCMHAFEVK